MLLIAIPIGRTSIRRRGSAWIKSSPGRGSLGSHGVRIAPCKPRRLRHITIMRSNVWSAIRAVGGPTVFTAPIDTTLIQSSSRGSGSNRSTTATTIIITIDSWAASGCGVLVISTDVMRKPVCQGGVGLNRGLRRITSDGLISLSVMRKSNI